MRTIVIGASGLVGRGLVRAARQAGHDVLGTFATQPGEGLVRFDMIGDRLPALVPDLGPEDVVFLLAGHVDQNWVFDHPEESRRVNVDGVVACAEAALGRGAHLVFLSTAAVFGAGCEQGCDEAMAPAPASLYARQKVAVETRLRQLGGRWCVARTGSIVGWGAEANCSVSATYRQLLSTGARMARDNRFTITDLDDVVAGLLALAARRFHGFIHLAANPPVVRTELADWVMADSRFGGKMAYEITTFSSISFPEARAAGAWLRNARAVGAMGLRFADPRTTARRKVALLDRSAARDAGRLGP